MTKDVINVNQLTTSSILHIAVNLAHLDSKDVLNVYMKEIPVLSVKIDLN